MSITCEICEETFAVRLIVSKDADTLIYACDACMSTPNNIAWLKENNPSVYSITPMPGYPPYDHKKVM